MLYEYWWLIAAIGIAIEAVFIVFEYTKHPLLSLYYIGQLLIACSLMLM